jgi:tetraacyldisaccharide 4'-kinase
MKTPEFWQSHNRISDLLVPISTIYDAISRSRRSRAKTETLPVPVICVGNLIAGGAGKTPVALAIGKLLKQKGINAFFLSRGYGGEWQGPALVNPSVDRSLHVGDEPLLLAKILPTVMAKNRLAGGRFAIEQGAKTIVMDDGFQNMSVAKTLSLLVIDGQIGFGNGRLIPAGPLRESLASGFARADAIVLINASQTLPPLPAGKPVLRAVVSPTESAREFKGKRVLAFCGMAYPQKFFATLEAIGAEIVHTDVFPDHYRYWGSEIKKLARQADARDAVLVTTAKDAVRMSPAWRSRVSVVDIELTFENPRELEALLEKAVAG